MSADPATGAVTIQPSPSLSSIGTEDGVAVVAAVERAEAEGLEDNPPLQPLGGHESSAHLAGLDIGENVSALGRQLFDVLSDPKNKITASVRKTVMDIFF